MSGTGSPSFRTATKIACSRPTGQSLQDRSKRRLSLPMDDGWRPRARFSERRIAPAEHLGGGLGGEVIGVVHTGARIGILALVATAGSGCGGSDALRREGDACTVTTECQQGLLCRTVATGVSRCSQPLPE